MAAHLKGALGAEELADIVVGGAGLSGEERLHL